MERVVRVVPGLIACLLSLMIPLSGRTAAQQWDEQLVSDGPLESSVLLPSPSTSTEGAAAATGEPPAGWQPPPSAFPADESSGMRGDFPTTVVSHGGHHEPACPPEVLHQPGLIQFLAARKNACWTLRADTIAFWRNAPPTRPIFSTIDPSTAAIGPTALNAADLNSDVLAAPRISFLRTDCEGRTLEATYLYAGNFYSDRSLPYSRNGYVTAPPGIFGNEWGVAGTQLNTATAKLLGQLQSLEFNSRHCFWQGTCQFLVGARWLQWNESLQMLDAFSAPPPPAPITDQGTDLYLTNCFNNLWGGQIGVDSVLLGAAGSSRIEGLVKAGAYYNHAGQYSSYSYATSSGGRFASATRQDGPAACSFVGEIGLTAVMPLSPTWDVRCGYVGLWLTGLAQPANQLSHQTITQIDPPSGTLDTTGTLILQGLSLGLEGRW